MLIATSEAEVVVVLNIVVVGVINIAVERNVLVVVAVLLFIVIGEAEVVVVLTVVVVGVINTAVELNVLLVVDGLDVLQSSSTIDTVTPSNASDAALRLASKIKMALAALSAAE